MQAEIEAIKEHHAKKLAEATTERESLLQKHAAELETAAATLAAAKAAHEIATRELEEKHIGASSLLKDGHAVELANLAAERAAELQTLIQQHSDELDDLKGSHSRALEEQSQNHGTFVASLTSSKDTELVDLKSRFEAINAELATLTSNYRSTSNTLTERELSLSTARQAIDELEAKLSNFQGEFEAAATVSSAAAAASASEITKLRTELSQTQENLKFIQGKNDADGKRYSKDRSDLEMELASAKNEIANLKEKVDVLSLIRLPP